MLPQGSCVGCSPCDVNGEYALVPPSSSRTSLYFKSHYRHVVHTITALNKGAGKVVAAYTFDAGPNGVIYTLKQHVPTVLKAVQHAFPAPEGSAAIDGEGYYRGKAMPATLKFEDDSGAAAFAAVESGVRAFEGEGLQYIFRTDVGDGPRTLETSLADEDGNAIYVAPA